MHVSAWRSASTLFFVWEFLPTISSFRWKETDPSWNNAHGVFWLKEEARKTVNHRPLSQEERIR